MSVPLAAFTTSGDGCCESSTTELYDNATVTPRVLRDMAGSSHLEPLAVAGAYNPWLATHTAAWFKLYVSEDSDPLWHSLLYDSSDPRSLCRFAPQRRCETAEEARPSRSTAANLSIVMHVLDDVGLGDAGFSGAEWTTPSRRRADRLDVVPRQDDRARGERALRLSL